ncbi:MAG: hypothetical protein EHM79_00415 [Geobacter sp.]|nr:MAG: hypothetical protein EHM79_00415 [Geobacter sp.]
MGILADIGRSNIGDTALGTANALNAYRQTDANVALSQAQLERMRNLDKREQMEMEEANKPIAIESFSHGFEGGEEGPMFKMVYDYVDKLGYIDKNQGGLGVIKKGDYKAISEALTEPNFASKLSRTRIDYWRGQLSQIKTAIKEKPNDQKLQAALQQTTDGLNQSLFQDKAMADAIKAQKEEEPKEWKPTTKEEALEMINAKEAAKGPKKWEPTTKEEAFALKRAGETSKTNEDKRLRQDFYYKKFSRKTDMLGNVEALTPSGKVNKLMGWLNTRKLERVLRPDELDTVEQMVMTDLMVPSKVQDTIRLAREAGATDKEIVELVRSSAKSKEWEGLWTE